MVLLDLLDLSESAQVGRADMADMVVLADKGVLTRKFYRFRYK